MTKHEGLPVHGYQPQSDAKVALVNEFKQDEERLLRKLDKMKRPAEVGLFSNKYDFSASVVSFNSGYSSDPHKTPEYNQALLAEARKTLMVGFMLLNRAVFQPQRIRLPEDDEELESRK